MLNHRVAFGGPGHEVKCPQCGFKIVVPIVYDIIDCPNCNAQLRRKSGKPIFVDEELVLAGDEAMLSEAKALEKWRQNNPESYKAQAIAASKESPLTAQEGKARDNAIRSGTKCMVCNLQLEKADSVVWCPHCLSAAHKAHLLRWLGLKRRCPICGRELNETELKRAPTSTMRPKM